MSSLQMIPGIFFCNINCTLAVSSIGTCLATNMQIYLWQNKPTVHGNINRTSGYCDSFCSKVATLNKLKFTLMILWRSENLHSSPHVTSSPVKVWVYSLKKYELGSISYNKWILCTQVVGGLPITLPWGDTAGPQTASHLSSRHYRKGRSHCRLSLAGKGLQN